VLQERQVSGLFSKIADKMTSISIKINKSNCTLCQQCVNHCPAEAMVRKNNEIIIDQEKCVECFCCGESCPNDAISAKFYLFRVLPYLIIGLVGFGIGIGFGIWYLVSLLSIL
jgi:ferredoxin